MPDFIFKDYIFEGLSITCASFFILWIIFLRLYIISARRQKKAETDALELKLVFAKFEAVADEKETQIKEYAARLEKTETENTALRANLTKTQSDMENQKRYMEEKINFIEQNKEELLTRFKDISNQVILAQNKEFNTTQKDTFNLLFKPFQDQLADFKKKVESVHQDNLENKTFFDVQIQNLLKANEHLSKDAEDLSCALKGNKKIQGNWGEFQLDRVLEISGLQKGLNYLTQETFETEDGKVFRPDVVVKLPNNRSVIVDSKVSLNDYVTFVNAEDETLKEEALKRHIACIKNHIDELSGKEYQKLIKKGVLDYVVIFIPIESAYVEAVRSDTDLYDYANRKNIAITTPSSLLPILRTIENLWQIENQNKYVSKIAEAGGALYDKISAFVEDMKHIDSALGSAQKSYNAAISKFATGKGSALSYACKLKEYGAKTNKELKLTVEENLLPQLENEVVNE